MDSPSITDDIEIHPFLVHKDFFDDVNTQLMSTVNFKVCLPASTEVIFVHPYHVILQSAPCLFNLILLHEFVFLLHEII